MTCIYLFIILLALTSKNGPVSKYSQEKIRCSSMQRLGFCRVYDYYQGSPNLWQRSLHEYATERLPFVNQ